MYDIEFLKAVQPLKDQIVAGEYTRNDAELLADRLDRLRDRRPHVFNVETTNHCNMTCVMCPRTTLMTRPVLWLDDAVFEKVLDQIQPHADDALSRFIAWGEHRHGVSFDRPDENAFYFHVVSRCLTLHGYGEPLMDRRIAAHVAAATRRGIPTYFSCVPANLTVARADAVMAAGLTVLKFSIDATTDEGVRQIRGPRADFTGSFQRIREVIDLRRDRGYRTLLVPTMIALSDDGEARKMHRDFLDLWRGLEAWPYIKSQDNRWYHEEDGSLENRSHYHSQYCEYPWTSLTVMADGSVVPCTQDYNSEMTMGNVHHQTLEEIWNGEPYREFRMWHVTGAFPVGHKCASRCDQKKLCGYLRE